MEVVSGRSINGGRGRACVIRGVEQSYMFGVGGPGSTGCILKDSDITILISCFEDLGGIAGRVHM